MRPVTSDMTSTEGAISPVPLHLAPMAGVSDLAFRLLARECGADVTITEFTAAAALTREDAYSWMKLETDPREVPFIPQIFGSDVDEMAHCTRLLQERADLIDLNFGCPAPKVTRHCAGAALMGEPDLLLAMVRACLAESEVPVTVKMRLGTGASVNNVVALAQELEAVGVARLCVHGRTLKQRYAGSADWETIRMVVEAVSIPVVANGDVVCAESARACLEATGAAGLMIGRGAIGRPHVFHEIKRVLGWTDVQAPWEEVIPAGADAHERSRSVRLWCWRRYVELDDEVHPEQGSKNRKRHAFSFTKGLRGGKALRGSLHSLRDSAELGQAVERFLAGESDAIHA